MRARPPCQNCQNCQNSRITVLPSSFGSFDRFGRAVPTALEASETCDRVLIQPWFRDASGSKISLFLEVQ
jgi:hypothetical protein